MRVVVVDSDLPYPATSGKRLRSLNLLLPLAARHRLVYLCRGREGTAEAKTAVEFLRDHNIEPVLFDHVLPGKRGLGFYGRLARNLLSPLPYSVATHRCQPLRDALRRHAVPGQVDLVHFEWAGNADALDAAAGLPWVVNSHNVDTLLWQRYFETERRLLRRWLVKQQWRKFERFERRVFRAATHVVAVSEDDAGLMRNHFGAEHVTVVDNGIDREFFEKTDEQRERPRDPEALLFLGSFDWRPNLDAIDLLLGDIFPRVRAACPSARLLLVGRKPSLQLAERIKATPGVELHADVPDVRPFLASCGVMVVPLRIGGGSRLKILEAMAGGLPVVSTRIGAEGLCVRPSEDYIRADSTEELAAALIAAIRDPRGAQAMAERVRPFILDRYDWKKLAEKLETVWEQSMREREADQLRTPNSELRTMNVVHLMASPFVGGPERVVLGLARALPAAYRTAFLSFAERGLARPFLAKAAETGFEAVELRYNVPRFLRAAREVADHLRRLRADVLCCNGYKPDIIGWLAAHRAGVPVVAIAHGWTAATWQRAP